MSLTFLGIENPLGVLGPKVKGVVVNAAQLKPIADVSKNTGNAANYASTSPTNKYVNRAANLPNEVNKMMVEDTIENRDYVLKLLAAARYPDLRLAMSSSLTSMLKYLDAYRTANAPHLFETVIMFGHGMPGAINMGLGKIGIGEPLPPHEANYQKRKDMRETFGLDNPSQGAPPTPRRVRNAGLGNQGVWVGAFQGVGASFEIAESGYFHLFLIGCSVGKNDSDVGTTLQKEAAVALATAIDLPVCISAPEKKVTEDHLDDLLARLPQIRKAAAAGENVILKGTSSKAVPLVSELGFN